MKHLKLLGYLGSLLLLLVAYSQPQGRGFTLSLNPESLSSPRGGSGSTTLTLTPQGGVTGSVAPSLLDASSGMTLSPTGVQVSGFNPVARALTLSVGGNVGPGTYTLKVRGTGRGLTREAGMSFTVIQATQSDQSGQVWYQVSGSLHGVAYGGGRWMAVGDEGTILTSP